MKIVRLHPDRVDAVREAMREARYRVIAGARVQLGVTSDGVPFAVCTDVTPQVQAFLAALGSPSYEREAGHLTREDRTDDEMSRNNSGDPHGAPSDAGGAREAEPSPSGETTQAAEKRDEESSRESDDPQGSAHDEASGDSCDCVPADNGDAQSLTPSDGEREEVTGGGDDRESSPPSAITEGESASASPDEGDATTTGAGEAETVGPTSAIFRKGAHSRAIYATARSSNSTPDQIARARRTLIRLALRGESNAGPRWNASRIAAKTAGWLRPWTASDRHDEDGLPRLIVAVDVSGSMSSICGDLVVAALSAQRAAQGIAEIVLCLHVNGEAVEIVTARGVFGINYLPIEEALPRIVRTQDVKAIVALGDTDAEDNYRALAQIAPPVLWLDTYASSHGNDPLIIERGALVHVIRAGIRRLWDALEVAAKAVQP